MVLLPIDLLGVSDEHISGKVLTYVLGVPLSQRNDKDISIERIGQQHCLIRYVMACAGSAGSAALGLVMRGSQAAAQASC